jgi:hypothetical protein
MALPAPSEAPLHESDRFPSAKVALTEQAVGAPQAVMSQKMLLLIFSTE